jgi:topoisomerase-4 subunit A
MKDGDYIRYFYHANTLDHLLFFTERGQSFVVPVHQVPEAKWKENGTALVNVVQIDKEDRIVQMFVVKDFAAPLSALFVTRRGQVKRTPLQEYFSTKRTGMVACKLNADDAVIEVLLSDNTKELLVASAKGWSIRFSEADVSEMGRNAGGVRAMKMAEDDVLVGALLVTGEEGEIAVITNLGYGKSSLLLDYPIQRRDGRGVPTIEFKEAKRGRSNGDKLIGMFYVREERQFTLRSNIRQAHPLSSEQLKIEERKAHGKSLVLLEKGEEITDLIFVQ